MASADEREALLEVVESLFGQFHLLLGFRQVDPCLGSVDGERQLSRAVVSECSVVVGPGGVIEIAEATPEVDFPTSCEGESVGTAGDSRGGAESRVVPGSRAGGTDAGKSGGSRRDGALTGGPQTVSGGLQVVVLPDSFPHQAVHAAVLELGEPAGGNLAVLPTGGFAPEGGKIDGRLSGGTLTILL